LMRPEQPEYLLHGFHENRGVRGENQMNSRRFKLAGLALCIAATTVAQGCASEFDKDSAEDGAIGEEDESEVATAQDPLYLLGQRWTNGQVSVCYDQSDPEQSRLAMRAKKILAATWSKYAIIDFNGWTDCSTSRDYQIVHLFFWANNSESRCSDMGPVNKHTDIKITDDDSPSGERFFVHSVIHEFGHALGFGHEMERPDNFGLPLDGSITSWSLSSAICPNFQSDRAQPYFNGTYLTDYDHLSVMSYCSNYAAHLTNRDIAGAINAYGKRTTSSTKGFMIISQGSRAQFALRGTGSDLDPVTTASNCTHDDPNCTWTFRDGMLVSDANPTLAINAWMGAAEGTILRTYKGCVPTDSNCTWTYTHGQFRSDTNQNLAMVPSSTTSSGGYVKLRGSDCANDNLECAWRLPGVMVVPHNRPMYALNAWLGASYGANLRWVDSCHPENPDCMWNFERGKITSARNASLAINAFNGAVEEQYLRLHDACTFDNPDCTWTWSRRGFQSDNEANGILSATGASGYITNGDDLWLRARPATAMDGL
jgi:hypothetical protein